MRQSIEAATESAVKESTGALGRINVSIEDKVGWIELDNPSKLNAISLGMWRDLTDALANFESDPGLRCVVITGHGVKAFCAGADISEKGRPQSDSAQDQDHLIIDALRKVQAFPKPTIAMVRGHCLGGGLALAIACDLRIAAVGSRFGIPAAKLGLACFHSVVERLAGLVGPSTAKRILFTADRFPGQDALRFGLIDELVDADQLRSAVRDMAAGIAANAPLTVAAAKHAVETVFSEASQSHGAACVEREQACIESQDYVEGRRAFLEKRAPVFQGR
ncbi:Carnitinyl-CoA dehydratase (plasmid) [Variovorax sp. SRS16]|uniref:enoyl-CoA hydratase n=1 Tax=Variovorax sp. SRS16 TaxID=282217 RepID=UPI0013171776|nr:enoyl-CoA hydratase [Variovorax sp. SRS16]VTU45378.1 Carnitinyl-CoA dehydratase [Variovorax sp. SRS16]